MKQTLQTGLLFLLALLIAASFGSCADAPETDALWEDAAYTADTTLGDGAKTVEVEVKAGEHRVTFTVKTDAETLGEALLALGLIDGDAGPFGLYIKKVNGITADFDVDQSYWAFYKNGEMMMTGADGTVIADGEHYEFEYAK